MPRGIEPVQQSRISDPCDPGTVILLLSQARSIRWPIWRAAALFAVMTLVVLYPIVDTQVPALGDYLNHLARMHILAEFDQSEALRGFYRVRWQPIPYLAMDGAFVVLDNIATIYQAGRIFVAICILLPVLAVAMLHFAVHRRLSLIPVAAFLFCYNYLLSWGFLNYLPAACLAVMLFAGWIGCREWPRWARAALFCLLALILYLCHLVAFGAYCLAVAGFELARAWRSGFRPWRAIAGDWVAAGLQAVPALVLALAVDVERPFVGPVRTSFGDLGAKVTALFSPVIFSASRLDLLAGNFALAVLVLGLKTGRLRLASKVWPAAAVVGTVAICMPNWLLGTFYMDVRLPLVVVMLLIGAISTTERMSGRLGLALLGGFLVLTAARSVQVASGLRTLDKQIAEVRQVVGEMPRGRRLLLVNTPMYAAVPKPWAWATSHVGMVAVIDRDAFVPNLFSGLGTVRPAQSLRASSTPNGAALSVADLTYGLGRWDVPGADNANGVGGRVYWLGWERKFDYVLVEHFGDRPVVLPNILRLVASSSVADLYQVDVPVSP